MDPIISSSIAAVCYTLCSIYQARHLLLGKVINEKLLIGLASAAITAHSISVYHLIFTQQGLNLGFFRVPSLIFWLISALLVISSLKKPVENLFIPLFALTAISIVTPLIVDSPYHAINHLSRTETAHILLSILAYSVFTIAAVHALVLAYQDRQIKQKHTRSILHALPPLETMEQLLFQMIWLGVILLTMSIITGFIFLEDMFMQKVVHKTVFSICAWLIFSILLWGHHFKGWRGSTALKWTITGFISLMLAFFGTKFVLELILHR